MLPKIEFSNPLNWSILVHEYGHLISSYEYDNFIKNLTKEYKLDIQNSGKIDSIKNWIEEMYCDIFATKLLGPAYLISFLSFCLLNNLDCSRYSNSHPSVHLRAQAIKSFLHRNNSDFSDTPLKNYGFIFNEKMILIDDICNSITKNNSLNSINETSILLTLRKFIHENTELKIPSKNTNENTEIVGLLIEKLKKNLPIGSISKVDDKQLLRLLSKETKDISTDDLILMKKLSIERSTSYWEILNAGWIYKIEQIENKWFELFFTKDSIKIHEKIEEYAESINMLDDILLHSISTSQIIKSIEKNQL